MPMSNVFSLTSFEECASARVVEAITVEEFCVADSDGEWIGRQIIAGWIILLSEVPVMEVIRNNHPSGLTPAQRKKLEEAVKGL